MMTPPNIATVDEFVAWEETQERKYEFADGTVSPFPGGTHRHVTIGANIVHALRLAGLPPASVLFEAKTLTPRSSRYPDITVTLDERDGLDLTVIRYPILIVEVLSPSTQSTDRGAKLDEYRAIETLREYVLIDSRKRWAQTVRRDGDDWIVSLPGATGDLEFRSVGVRVPFDACYAGTELV